MNIENCIGWARKVAREKGEISGLARRKFYMFTGIDAQSCYGYEDEHVEIFASAVNDALYVVRKDNQNPVLTVKADGTINRKHGEIKYIEDHLRELANPEERA